MRTHCRKGPDEWVAMTIMSDQAPPAARHYEEKHARFAIVASGAIDAKVRYMSKRTAKPAPKTTTDQATYYFANSSAAWAFMRACETAGVAAGFPALRAPTVCVSVPTWKAREIADKLAGSTPISYQFAGSPIIEA